jgi:hypothetical protein
LAATPLPGVVVVLVMGASGAAATEAEGAALGGAAAAAADGGGWALAGAAARVSVDTGSGVGGSVSDVQPAERARQTEASAGRA